jgi:superfamily II DNA or RNA helicase/diadenosine tetraphosphate (Ap4A) HIT family hydrolase
MNSLACPFCEHDQNNVFLQTSLVVGFWSPTPFSTGHALLVTRRHAETWFDTTSEEKRALLTAIDMVREEIIHKHNIDSFSIGWNVGTAAGQTIPHTHIDIIPRLASDHKNGPNPNPILIPKLELSSLLPNPRVTTADLPHERAIISGGEDAFLPHLLAHIDNADSLDIAVAFIRQSGLALIEEHLRDLLDRGGKLRVVAGDYFDVTEPEALRRLLDFEGSVLAKIYETGGQVSFHPKAYILHLPNGVGIAYIGSSNLTKTALCTGLEWNARVITSRDKQGFNEVVQAFEALLKSLRVKTLNNQWIDDYQKRRKAPKGPIIEVDPEPIQAPPLPHAIQIEALNALEQTRASGHSAGLVVMATGLGKTWLSAFDSNRPEFQRLLFVAHREEILSQAMKTFRRIHPDAHIGRYTGLEKTPEAHFLFASIQTLGRSQHLRRFAPRSFDYIVIDEFHHAAARTYRKLIDHFDPKFLLGLTATPERTDGGDLLALCQQNLLYRCDVIQGIERGLLCPFKYFGIPDEVDYQNIPWRSSRFDEKALTIAVATEARAANALEQLRKLGGKRTLAFCCSQRHADFMADYLREQGVKVAAVHSGQRSAPRAASLEALGRGDLDVVCAVDMFNEGVDLPKIDTILMLRPTESGILWTQQFGRGLRRAVGKDHLRVIDYIGNHRVFLTKPRTLLNLGPGDGEIERGLNALSNGTLELPPGCEITYDLKAVNVLRSLLRRTTAPEALKAYYLDFRERHGQRPTALETMQEGFLPRSVRPAYGLWHGFVNAMGCLDDKMKRVPCCLTGKCYPRIVVIGSLPLHEIA